MLCDFSLVIIILKIRAIKIFLKPFLRFCYLMCFDAKNAPVLFGITLCTKKRLRANARNLFKALGLSEVVRLARQLTC